MSRFPARSLFSTLALFGTLAAPSSSQTVTAAPISVQDRVRATPALAFQDGLAATAMSVRGPGGWLVFAFVSEDDGTTWGSSVRLDSDTTFRPKRLDSTSVAIQGDEIFVLWEDDREGLGRSATKLYLARSLDRGATWLPEQRVDAGYTPTDGHPVRDARLLTSKVAGSATNVYVVFSVRGSDGVDTLNVTSSTDGGATFQVPVAVPSVSAVVEQFAATLADSGRLNVVWQDDRDGTDRLYHRGSVPGTLSWAASEGLLNPAGNVTVEEIAFARRGARLVIAWQEQDGSTTWEQLYATVSIDAGQTFATPVRVGAYEPALDDVDAPTAAVSASSFVVAWSDDRTNRDEIYSASTADGVTWTETAVSPALVSTGGRHPQFPRSNKGAGPNLLAWDAVEYPSDTSLAVSFDSGASWAGVVTLSGPTAGDVDETVLALDSTTIYRSVAVHFGSSPTSTAFADLDRLWASTFSVP